MLSGPLQAGAGETPTRLRPFSLGDPFPEGGALSLHAPCSCLPAPGGSGSLVHSTEVIIPFYSWDAGAAEGTDYSDRGTFTHRKAGGDELTCRGWWLAVLPYSAGLSLLP